MVNVTGTEESIFYSIKTLGKPIGEDRYHAICELLDSSGRGLGFKDYRLEHWRDIDSRFESDLGAAYYSSQLHEAIEELVRKGRLKRNPKNLLELSVK